MTIELTDLEAKALRMAAIYMLDDDDIRSKLYDWQIEAFQKLQSVGLK